MTHRMSSLEVSHRLALAIGWLPEQLRVLNGDLYCYTGAPYRKAPASFSWRKFDYRDWAVTGPIAAALCIACVPHVEMNETSNRLSVNWSSWPTVVPDAADPQSIVSNKWQTSIAFAVINQWGANFTAPSELEVLDV
jgi:hypothetical protein